MPVCAEQFSEFIQDAMFCQTTKSTSQALQVFNCLILARLRSQLVSRDQRLWRPLFGFPVARARQASFGWAYHGVFTGVFDSTSVNYWGLGLWEVSETVLVMFLESFSGLGRIWSHFCWTWQDCKFTVMADMLPRSGTTTHEDATWRHGHKSTQNPQGSQQENQEWENRHTLHGFATSAVLKAYKHFTDFHRTKLLFNVTKYQEESPGCDLLFPSKSHDVTCCPGCRLACRRSFCYICMKSLHDEVYLVFVMF